MFDITGWTNWLLLAVVGGWALRLAYKFGLETGREETAARFMEDPQRALRQIEVERAAEGRFRRWARGRGN